MKEESKNNKKKRSAFDAACGYLSFRERSAFEIREYLREKGYDGEERDAALEKLKESGFVNDGGFADRYIEYAMSKGRGPKRIRRELRQKGISPEDIEDAFYRLEENGTGVDWQERAAEQAAESLKSDEAASLQNGERLSDRTAGRISRRLDSLGYDGSHVRYALGRLRAMRGEKDE